MGTQTVGPVPKRFLDPLLRFERQSLPPFSSADTLGRAKLLLSLLFLNVLNKEASSARSELKKLSRRQGSGNRVFLLNERPSQNKI